MHIFDELTEQLEIMKMDVNESSEFSSSNKSRLSDILEEAINLINEIAE